MIALAWLLFAVALGCALVWRYGRLSDFQPRWAMALLVFGTGSAAGVGLTSSLFFLCRLAVPGVPKLSLIVECAALAWLAYEIRKQGAPAAKGPATPAAQFNVLLIAGLLLALGISTGAMSDAWDTNPAGNWDAWSIWNLRARFLAAGGALPHRAWSPALQLTHPEYPLLLSGFIARCWAYAGSQPDVVPIATSYLFFLAGAAIVIGGMAVWRSRILGLLFGLALLGTPTYLHEAVTQYADIPLACYFAGATMFALLDRPLLAGLFASLAAWTKDEGVMFLAVFLIAVAILRRGQIARVALGAAPVATIVIFFKAALAPSTSVFLGQPLAATLHRIVDPVRLGSILGQFVQEITAMSAGWYHPILPLLVLALALRFDRERRRDALFAAAIPAVMLAGYFGIFLITPNDLTWQLQTSFYRLIDQIWPSFLLAAFVAFNAPESIAVSPPEAQAKERKKTKARSA